MSSTPAIYTSAGKLCLSDRRLVSQNKIGNGKGILLKHTAPKNLAFKSDLAMLITFALKEITQPEVTQEHLDRLKYILQQVPKEHILQDAKLMPEWIKKIIQKLYE
ncbi:hypothetical protein AGMMS4957_15950 [Bacteroidia bacterium]|nr:hypothetical protein AGMMS4957_15950 [Bacteroidia bacterium]